MDHWKLADIPWKRFEPGKVDPEIVRLVKAASLVEHNGGDYCQYLAASSPTTRSSRKPPGFGARKRSSTARRSAAGPSWPIPASTTRRLARASARAITFTCDPQGSVRGSRSGELIARCMVETGTSSYYTALAEASQEPVLKEICRHIAADELRHYKLFYTHLKRYLEIEKPKLWRRLLVALIRIVESEDDELAFAYHAANEREDAIYYRRRAVHAYLRRAYAVYRRPHVERGMAMIFKAVGLKPNGRLESTAARIAWWTMRLRAFALEQGGLIPARGYRTEKARIPPTGRDRAIA